MKKKFNSFSMFSAIPGAVLVMLVLFQISACSTANLQTDRLNSVEDYLQQVEVLLSSSQNSQSIYIADEKLGTAKAYLETLRDNRKFLTENELRRYNALKQRANSLARQIHL